MKLKIGLALASLMLAGNAFAAGTNAIPVTVSEFLRAGRHYPIIFGGSGEDLHSMVVVGLTEGANLFVDPASGFWEADHYLPAYVRRYPFILARQGEAGDFAVCIDEACPDFSQSEGEALFDAEGEQSDYLKRSIDFVREYQQDHERSRHFARALDEAGLLEEVNADVSLEIGEKYRLGGLRVISRRRLQDLPDKLCRDWLRNGYLEHAFLHLASLTNFSALVERLAVRQGKAKKTA